MRSKKKGKQKKYKAEKTQKTNAGGEKETEKGERSGRGRRRQ